MRLNAPAQKSALKMSGAVGIGFKGWLAGLRGAQPSSPPVPPDQCLQLGFLELSLSQEVGFACFILAADRDESFMKGGEPPDRQASAQDAWPGQHLRKIGVPVTGNTTWDFCAGSRWSGVGQARCTIDPSRFFWKRPGLCP